MVFSSCVFPWEKLRLQSIAVNDRSIFGVGIEKVEICVIMCSKMNSDSRGINGKELQNDNFL